jgi:hypothetical protein
VEPRYSFDTSSFLNGRRDLLPPAVFVSLWSNIEEMITAGEVRSVEVVRDELSRRDDEVKAWATSQSDLFVGLSTEIQEATSEILRDHSRLMGAGRGRNAADPFVIAYGRVIGGIVVTEETPRGRMDNPRIPDVCEALGVPCLSLVGFVQAQGWTF